MTTNAADCNDPNKIIRPIYITTRCHFLENSVLPTHIVWCSGRLAAVGRRQQDTGSPCHISIASPRPRWWRDFLLTGAALTVSTAPRVVMGGTDKETLPRVRHASTWQPRSSGIPLLFQCWEHTERVFVHRMGCDRGRREVCSVGGAEARAAAAA